jgi:hypothetical protein
MMKERITITDSTILDRIYLIRGIRVMMDRDLAELYGVETKVLNQAVKRNINRFPHDFMFQLDELELHNWKSQFVTSNYHRGKMGLRKLPFVFTELGVAMLSSVLRSDIAIEVNIQIVRIFSRMHEYFLTHKDVLIKLEQLENQLLKDNEVLRKHDSEIQFIFETLKRLINPPDKPRKQIGFKTL